MAAAPDLQPILNHLLGQPLIEVVYGPGTGSAVTFDFGEWVKRERPRNNPHASAHKREYQAEYTLFLQGCSWRLENPEAVICGSWENNDWEGRTSTQLQSLLGLRVASVVCEPPGFDLKLQFEGGKTLQVFCDLSLEDEPNYTFYIPDTWYHVGPKSKLEVGDRDS